MHYRLKIFIVLFLILAGFNRLPVFAQQYTGPARGSVAFFDSLSRRADYLEKQVARLKQVRDVTYLNLQRELDHTVFVRTYEEYLLDENLEMAKELVQKRIERSEFRRDQSSLVFYRKYEEDIYAQIKQQRSHYQSLFLKEKNFKKEFERYISPGTLTSYEKARRMVKLAIKFAQENKLTETVGYLNLYDSFCTALIFDLQSDYDLAALTNNAKNFEKIFIPLVESDSLAGINEAEKLLNHCKNYGRLTGSSLDGEYFRKQELRMTSALTDLLEKQGREKELIRYTDQSVVAKYDTINPCGVFKWHNQIVVIDEFIPDASIENVKKGQAILHADKMLATYLEKNKLCQSIEDLKFGYAFIIPYRSNARNTSFYFNASSKKWQYIACYTVIVDPAYTQQVSKFMPPLFFEDEMDTASR